MLRATDLDRAIEHLDRAIAAVDAASTAVRTVERKVGADREGTTWWMGPQGEDLRRELGELETAAGKALPAWHDLGTRLTRLRGDARELRGELAELEAELADTEGVVATVTDAFADLGQLLDPRPDVDLLALRRSRIRSDIEDVGARWTLALSGAESTLRGALAIVRSSTPDASSVTFGKLRMPAGDALDDLLRAQRGEPGTAPEDVAAWWATLSAAEIELWIAGAPDLVGNTNGVPFEHRIAANHVAMQDLLDRLPEGHPLRDTLKQFTIAGTDTIDPSRQILLFDAEGDGRVAELFGDLETASQIAIIVPGITNKLDGFTKGLADNGRSLWGASPDTAVIAWTGYDTPDIDLGAASSAKARVGGALLASFVTGVQVHHDQPITLIGHSYGSLTTGHALRQGAQVENVVFLGSPGVGVDHVSQFPKGAAKRYYAAEIDGDVVATLEHHGDAPTDPDFGAITFDAGDSRSPNPITRHSSYFNDGIGLENLATILEGGQPTPDRPTWLEHGLEHVEDGLELHDRGIDLVQDHVVVHSPPVDRLIDSLIDGAQTGSDHAEQLILAGVETGYNVGSDLAEDVVTGVGRTLADGVTGLPRRLLRLP